MVTPVTVYDYHPATGALETLKVQEIPSGYDAVALRPTRRMVPARDGKQVPVSVVYRKGLARRLGKVPLRLRLLRPRDPAGVQFEPHQPARPRLGLRHRPRPRRRRFRPRLVPRRQARQENQHVQRLRRRRQRAGRRGFHKAGNIAINGRSAGGELVGAVANSDPGLWGAVVADVPFVDVLNTMLDDTLPLTPGEWPEWGNPIADKAVFDYIRSYSPYDNVKPQAYPPMLITGGLTDPRVTYWEPAKWAARLRATKTDDNLLLLKVNMGAGHGGKSGRWEGLHEVAETYAFILTEVA